MIYFIQLGTDGPIKIGTSENPQARLAQLQTSNPEKLHLLGTMTGNNSMETKLHQTFSPFRLEGEWFSPASELLKFISENADATETSGTGSIQFLEKEFRAAKLLALNMGLDERTAIRKANDLVLTATGKNCADLLGISFESRKKPETSFEIWWDDWKLNRFENPVPTNKIYDDYTSNISLPVAKNRFGILLKTVIQFKKYRPRIGGARPDCYLFEK
ncbi:MAG: hypothetical protein DRI57_09140 [Deltaproteobacteria bacterium]|nr:MAG: hypothetical protein DRI57_09140 [Deltaproteobacteria bacterium]